MTPLERAAVATYQFRNQKPGESYAVWRAKLIAHVATRDMAAAHEVRVGRKQAEWTTNDVRAFGDWCRDAPGPRETLRPGVQVYPAFDEAGHAVTEETLVDLATRGLDAVCAMRHESPTADIAIFASVLLLTGHYLTVPVSSGDRLAILKLLARDKPVFGFVLVFDGWVHRILPDHTAATKCDAFMAQIGTREMRRMLIRPYRFVDGLAVFDAAYEMNPRQFDDDPYASIFVSVPAPTGQPS